jgi:hypothetical protein
MKYRVTAFVLLAITLLALPRQLGVIAAAQDTFSLSGRITTDYGCGISEASVVITSIARPSVVLAKTVTDVNGRYSFDRLPEPDGPVRIVAQADGFAPAQHTMVIGRNHANIWDAGLALGRLFDPGYRLAGAVVDSQKQPLADATVSLLRPHFDGSLLQVRTDKAGRFSFDNLDEGAYIVTVTRPAYEASSRLVETTPGNAKLTQQTFTLAPCKRCPTGRLL